MLINYSNSIKMGNIQNGISDGILPGYAHFSLRLKKEMNEKFSIIKHPLGLFEVHPKPLTSELSKYYAKKYYQGRNGSYAYSYSKNELQYFKVSAEIALRTIYRFLTPKPFKLLDLGCGEGFFADFFCREGWEANLV